MPLPELGCESPDEKEEALGKEGKADAKLAKKFKKLERVSDEYEDMEDDGDDTLHGSYTVADTNLT